jgi:hypothetical protein
VSSTLCLVEYDYVDFRANHTRRLKYHLRLWILIKAFNRMRNRVRPFAKMNSQVEADAHTTSSTSKRVDASVQQSNILSTNDERVYRTLRDRETGEQKDPLLNTDEHSDVRLSKAAHTTRSDGLAEQVSTVSTPASAQTTGAKKRRRRKKIIQMETFPKYPLSLRVSIHAALLWTPAQDARATSNFTTRAMRQPLRSL